MLFTIKDLNNKNGSINFNSQTVEIDSNKPLNFSIRSFDDNFNYLYRYESLPLDWLIENEVKIESKPCAPTNPWLNCLQSDRSVKFSSCSNSYHLNLSYGFDFSSEFFRNLTIAPKRFEFKFTIYCNLLFFFLNQF